jgi:hypothetical protein
MKVYEMLSWLLIIILAIASIGRIFIATINPEVFFFGEKLGGKPAKVYLLANGFIGILPIVLLLRKIIWKVRYYLFCTLDTIPMRYTSHTKQ